jgi:hypothetical protein
MIVASAEFSMSDSNVGIASVAPALKTRLGCPTTNKELACDAGHRQRKSSASALTYGINRLRRNHANAIGKSIV